MKSILGLSFTVGGLRGCVSSPSLASHSALFTPFLSIFFFIFCLSERVTVCNWLLFELIYKIKINKEVQSESKKKREKKRERDGEREDGNKRAKCYRIRQRPSLFLSFPPFCSQHVECLMKSEFIARWMKFQFRLDGLSLSAFWLLTKYFLLQPKGKRERERERSRRDVIVDVLFLETFFYTKEFWREVFKTVEAYVAWLVGWIVWAC